KSNFQVREICPAPGGKKIKQDFLGPRFLGDTRFFDLSGSSVTSVMSVIQHLYPQPLPSTHARTRFVIWKTRFVGEGESSGGGWRIADITDITDIKDARRPISWQRGCDQVRADRPCRRSSAACR